MMTGESSGFGEGSMVPVLGPIANFIGVRMTEPPITRRESARGSREEAEGA
jgi:hypothetical protein